jgi:hypothetical protein
VEGQPRFGSCKGSLVILTEDDERLKDFAEYIAMKILWTHILSSGLRLATRNFIIVTHSTGSSLRRR